jgi:hypothetical protein
MRWLLWCCFSVSQALAQHDSPEAMEKPGARQTGSKCDDIERGFCSDADTRSGREATNRVRDRAAKAFLGSVEDRRPETVSDLVRKRLEAAGHTFDPSFPEADAKQAMIPFHFLDPRVELPPAKGIPIELGKSCRLGGRFPSTTEELQKTIDQISKRLHALGDRIFLPDSTMDKEVALLGELRPPLPRELQDWQGGGEGRKRAMEELIQRQLTLGELGHKMSLEEHQRYDNRLRWVQVQCLLVSILEPQKHSTLGCGGPLGSTDPSYVGPLVKVSEPQVVELEGRLAAAMKPLVEAPGALVLTPMQRNQLSRNLNQALPGTDLRRLLDPNSKISFGEFRSQLKTEFEKTSFPYPVPPESFRAAALCNLLVEYEIQDFFSIRDQVGTDASLERNSVLSVQNAVYPPDQRRPLEAQFQKTKQYLDGLLDRVLPGTAPNHEAMARRVRSTELYWPDPSQRFVPGPDGVERLDPSTIGPGDAFYAAVLADPYFSNGHSPQAFFTTPEAHGASSVGSKPRVTVKPGMIEQFRNQPMAMALVMGHELGHALDPRIEQSLGNKVSVEHQRALDCLKANPKNSKLKTMGMMDHQQGECFADLVAAEIVAKMVFDKDLSLDGVPSSPEARAQQALSALCSFRDDFQLRRPNEQHPPPRLRINAILGAHPQIRVALGCPSEGPYPYCGAGVLSQGASP